MCIKTYGLKFIWTYLWLYMYMCICVYILSIIMCRWIGLQWWGKPMMRSLKWSKVYIHDFNTFYLLILPLGNSHVALTLLCCSSGSNGTNQQQTIGMSPPMAAGAAKGHMYICIMHVGHCTIGSGVFNGNVEIICYEVHSCTIVPQT